MNKKLKYSWSDIVIVHKRVIVCIAVICCLSLIAGISFSRQRTVLGHSVGKPLPVVIIDAGHGGFDGGAVADDGTVEKDINLEISLVLRDFLKQAGYKTVMTRNYDIATDDVETKIISTRKKSDLKNRVALMREYPDGIYVSIHLNKFTTSAANGAQVFYSQNSDNSKELGESI
ncbi:MAG: N-acetylmuramoyl-L-alanine amidase, partial [Clostridia bacterium]|nr:N-acetylmuramoyl-L-alanine amidase [Clostridia bacterium]